METSTIVLLIAGWYGAGLLGCSVASAADWYTGVSTTLKDVLVILFWSALGPVIAVIAIGIAAKTLFHRIPDRVLIEGRKRA